MLSAPPEILSLEAASVASRTSVPLLAVEVLAVLATSSSSFSVVLLAGDSAAELQRMSAVKT